MKTIIFVFSLFVVTVRAKYDCRRESGLCKNNGTCDQTSGGCSACASGFEGYDCSVVTADKGHADCAAKPCKNGGTCHRAAAGPLMCLCPEKFTGSTCEVKRYELICTFAGDGSMSMKVRPHVNTFSGSVYVQGKKNEASCNFAGTPLALGPLSNTDVTCGPTTNVNTERKRVIVVQFHSLTNDEQDELVTFTCGTSDTIETQSSPVTVNALAASFQAVASNNAPLDEDVDMKLVPDTVKADGSIDMGTEVTVSANLTDVGVDKFQNIRLEECIASNKANSSESGYEMKYLVKNGCKHSDLGHTFVKELSKTGDLVEFSFKAFKFTSSVDLFITCKTKLCPVSADCDPLSCDGGVTFTGYGRKKREASNIDKLLQRALIINDPFVVAAANALQEFKETKACYQSWEVTSTVVALAVALLLVILICVILIIKAILNRRSRSAYREDVSETSSTARFPHLPTIVSDKA